jgi:hypothetical protein
MLVHIVVLSLVSISFRELCILKPYQCQHAKAFLFSSVLASKITEIQMWYLHAKQCNHERKTS